jgi:hypothetical protein
VVVCFYNPSYSGGEGRKITSSRSAQEKLGRPYLRNKIQTKELGAWLKRGRVPIMSARMRPWFNPQYNNNNNKFFRKLLPVYNTCILFHSKLFVLDVGD